MGVLMMTLFTRQKQITSSNLMPIDVLLKRKPLRMFKPVALCAVLCVSSLFTANADALLVITHEENVVSLNKQQIRNIFMGNGGRMGLTPVALENTNRARTLFNTKVVGLTESRIQSYWAQMRFSGRMKPPAELESEAQVIDYVKNNKDAIAYITAEDVLPDGVKVLYSID